MSGVKIGYKRTEVGEIPEQWECEKLENFLSFISYGFTNPMPTVEVGVVMVTATDVADGGINYNTARRTSLEAFENRLTAKSKPRCNDILLTKDGALGRVAVVDDTTICINQSVAVLRPNHRVHSKFLSALLQANQYQRKMLEDAGGSTIKHIYITIVNQMPVGIPKSVDEQKTIVKALGDVEELIAALAALIAKKRDIKQGAMQELLSGQRRLPGFTADWELKRLDQIGEVCAGLTYNPSQISDDGHIVLRSSNVQEGALAFEDVVRVKSDAALRSLVEVGDILICVRNGSRSMIGKCALIPELGEPMAFGAFMSVFRTKHSRFLFQAFNSEILKRQIDEHLGATINQITNRSLKSFEVKLPVDQDEEDAIALILADMDAEISALEAKLTKTREVKQSMMQLLLTGEVRLV